MLRPCKNVNLFRSLFFYECVENTWNFSFVADSGQGPDRMCLLQGDPQQINDATQKIQEIIDSVRTLEYLRVQIVNSYDLSLSQQSLKQFKHLSAKVKTL